MKRISRVLALICAIAVVPAAVSAASRGHREYSGNAGYNTWTYRNYKKESGAGQRIKGHTAILMSCRVRGAKVSDGNVWWYRIASSPWDNRFYVSADDFYNNGQRTGPLRGTPFFDPKVPLC